MSTEENVGKKKKTIEEDKFMVISLVTIDQFGTV